ncbi:hypothetical protein HUV48_00480 [Altererythrobacter sp. HHU K3-1]|uniref:TtsA-like Glycoside hydrolase family 108 domain-containing protein n=2 Tax=Qipengyuania atrilutea TaxID=2744473 RepID=A0A850GVH8_9SPHN|nr:hypothetical protein [Actirhodobacter atriluteus]
MDRKRIFDLVDAEAPGIWNIPGSVLIFDGLLDLAGSVLPDKAKPAPAKGEGAADGDAFGSALAVILRHEGGYVNDPDDAGGRTNLGVTQRVWEKFVGRKVGETEMRALTPEMVEPLYERHYWEASGADLLPLGLGLCVFDFAVNAGPARAVAFLQEVVGATPDGRFGPQTLAEVLKDVQDVGEPTVIALYQKAREGYYRTRKMFWKYGKGWLRRNAETTEAALALAK